MCHFLLASYKKKLEPWYPLPHKSSTCVKMHVVKPYPVAVPPPPPPEIETYHWYFLKPSSLSHCNGLKECMVLYKCLIWINTWVFLFSAYSLKYSANLNKCLDYLPIPDSSSNSWSIFPCMFHLHMSGLSNHAGSIFHAWSIFPCLVYLPLPSISSHAWSIFPCLVYLPMPGLSSHAWSIFPCMVYLPMPGISSHAWSIFPCLV